MSDADIIAALEQAGAKRALPKREPGWRTKAELEIMFNAAENSKHFGEVLQHLIDTGQFERMDVYDTAKRTKCIVYRMIEKAV